MNLNVFYLAVIGSLVVVFATTIHLSLKGWVAAKYFLWLWALLLIVAAASFREKYTVRTDVAGLALLCFIYTLLVFSRRGKSDLDSAQEEIRRLLAESNKRMDEERRRISRRLHDDINPKLVIAKLELQQLRVLLDGRAAGDEETELAKLIIEKLLASISNIYDDSRQIIKNTRIEIIDSIGLTAAIESCVTHYNSVLEQPRIELEHNLAARPGLPPAVAVNVYRIVQEALLNAVKHASASVVTVSIQQSGSRYQATVADDGVGISSKSAHGIGLIDMRERAHVLGSDLVVKANGKKGTLVSFSFSAPGPSSQT